MSYYKAVVMPDLVRNKVASMDEAIAYVNAELSTYSMEDLIQFYLDRRVDEILLNGIPNSEGEG